MSEEKSPVIEKPEPKAQGYEQFKRLDAAEARLDRIEKLLQEIFEFLGEETRPVFGQQHIAAMYDAVAKRLKTEFGADDGEK